MAESKHHGTLEAQRNYAAKHRGYYRAYSKRYTEMNRQYFRDQKRVAALKKRNFINGLKGRPCMDCHVEYPACVMQFDHRDSQTKSFNIGNSESRTLEAIQLEAEKCDVVCANCHAIRTASRKPRRLQ